MLINKTRMGIPRNACVKCETATCDYQESVTIRQKSRWTKRSLCTAMPCRWHKKVVYTKGAEIHLSIKQGDSSIPTNSFTLGRSKKLNLYNALKVIMYSHANTSWIWILFIYHSDNFDVEDAVTEKNSSNLKFRNKEHSTHCFFLHKFPTF